jgi:C-terminal processing protease CtpA/Prc
MASCSTLRHNGGGFLGEAIELAGLFIPKAQWSRVKSFSGEMQVDRDTTRRSLTTAHSRCSSIASARRPRKL